MAGLPRAYVRLEEVPPNRARREGRSSEVTGSTVVICLGPSPESDIGKCFTTTQLNYFELKQVYSLTTVTVITVQN